MNTFKFQDALNVARKSFSNPEDLTETETLKIPLAYGMLAKAYTEAFPAPKTPPKVKPKPPALRLVEAA